MARQTTREREARVYLKAITDTRVRLTAAGHGAAADVLFGMEQDAWRALGAEVDRRDALEAQREGAGGGE